MQNSAEAARAEAAGGIDVLSIGNAIVDIIAPCADDFLDKHGIVKAAMNLIDAERAAALYRAMGEHSESSGGSAANTAAAVAGFGGKASYIGKVADDGLGSVFRRDLQAQNVAYATAALPAYIPVPTARSMIFVTPDGERSMNTYLGACTRLSKLDISEQQVAAAKITYFEGYLWDLPQSKQALLKAADLCRQNGRKMAMSLSDSFCVDRYRDEFLQLIRSGAIGILLANEAELLALYQTNIFERALEALRADKIETAAITRGAKGALILGQSEQFSAPAMTVENIIDKTGAGDLYAAGFLYGLTQNFGLRLCDRLGALAAGLVISQIGPRLNFSLRHVAQQAGLLS